MFFFYKNIKIKTHHYDAPSFFASKACIKNYLEAFFFILVATIAVPRATTPAVARTATVAPLLSPVTGAVQEQQQLW